MFRARFGSGLVRSGTGGMVVRVVNLLATVGTSAVLARACGAEGFGTYAYVFAIVQILTVPAQMGFQTLVIREMAAYRTRQQWGLLAGVLRFTRVAVTLGSLLLAVAGITAVSLAWIGRDPGISRTLLWGFALLPLIGLANLHGAALRGLELVVRGQLPELLVRPVGFLIFSFLAWRLVGPVGFSAGTAMALHVAAACLACATGIVLLERALPREVRGVRRASDRSRWIRSGTLLGGISGLQVVNSQTDIVMLGLMSDAATVGVYRVALQGALVVAFVLKVVNMVAAPSFARYHVQHDLARLQRTAVIGARISVAGALPAVLGFAFFGREILTFLFGHQFAGGAGVLLVLAGGQLVNAAMGSVLVILNMTGHESQVARGLLISATLNIVLNLALIPVLGMMGAAIATVATLMLWNGMLARSVIRMVGIRPWAFAPAADRQ